MNRRDKWRQIAAMDYSEHPPAPALEGVVKVHWTLAGAGPADSWIEQQAVPDGCVEIIRRRAGRSRWDGDQPPCFAVGLIERGQAFAISGDSRFEGIRIWPWAWQLLSDIPLAEMRGRWIDFAGAEVESRLAAAPALAAIGKAIVASQSVAAMGRATEMSPRTLQRWFARNVGLPPRRYLRLLRFQKAFEQMPGGASLAAQAAAQGFADQAHMAREFREMAGMPARQARRIARGPFLT